MSLAVAQIAIPFTAVYTEGKRRRSSRRAADVLGRPVFAEVTYCTRSTQSFIAIVSVCQPKLICNETIMPLSALNLPHRARSKDHIVGNACWSLLSVLGGAMNGPVCRPAEGVVMRKSSSEQASAVATPRARNNTERSGSALHDARVQITKLKTTKKSRSARNAEYRPSWPSTLCGKGQRSASQNRICRRATTK